MSKSCQWRRERAERFLSLIYLYIQSEDYEGKIRMGSAVRKCVCGHMRTSKAQISLRIRIIWSGLSLSANRIFECYNTVWMARISSRCIHSPVCSLSVQNFLLRCFGFYWSLLFPHGMVFVFTRHVSCTVSIAAVFVFLKSIHILRRFQILFIQLYR